MSLKQTWMLSSSVTSTDTVSSLSLWDCSSSCSPSDPSGLRHAAMTLRHTFAGLTSPGKSGLFIGIAQQFEKQTTHLWSGRSRSWRTNSRPSPRDAPAVARSLLCVRAIAKRNAKPGMWRASRSEAKERIGFADYIAHEG